MIQQTMIMVVRSVLAACDKNKQANKQKTSCNFLGKLRDILAYAISNGRSINGNY